MSKPNDLHDWECISPGEYDSTYRCTRCRKRVVESIDNPATYKPVDGCTYAGDDTIDAHDLIG